MPQNRHIPIFPSSLGAEALIRVLSEDVLWVDALTHTPPQAMQGSLKYPYDTIQKALTACGLPATAAEETRGHVVNVLPGLYEESLVPPAAGVVFMNAWGRVELGTLAVPRSIAWETDQSAVIGATMPTLIIDAQGARAIGTAFHVTGNITLTEAVGGAGACALLLQGVDIDGNVDASAKAGVAYLQWADVNIDGLVTAATANAIRWQSVVVDGNVTVDTYEQLDRVLFGGNVTVTTAPAIAHIRGLVHCDFAGAPTWTGPAESLQCDSYTWRMFAESGGALAGAATAVILDGGSTIRQIATAGSQLTADVIGATTETAHDGLVIPSEEVGAVGAKLTVRALIYADSDNAADTWTVRARFGGAAGPPPTGDLVMAMPAFNLTATSGIVVEISITITGVGAGGTYDAHIRAYNEVGAAVYEDLIFGGAINTTVDALFVITGECSSANAANQVTLRELVVASSYATV